MQVTPTTTSGVPRQRWREWATVAVLCLGLGLAYSGSGKLRRMLRGEPVDWSTLLTSELLHFGAWIVLYPAVAALAARFPLGERRTRSLGVHLAAALVFSPALMSLTTLARSLLTAAPLPAPGTLLREVIVPEYAWGMTAYLVLLSVASAGEWRLRDERRASEGARLEAALTLARLQALRMQLQPHFLFNALNSVSSLLRRDPDGAERMLARLGDFLRVLLDDGMPQQVPLRRELALLDSYLAIERVRFRDRLTVEVDLPPELLEARVPTLILQPLFENAIRHGIGERAGPARVRLTGRAEDGRLQLFVEDDGRGHAPDRPGSGVGLSNIRARLEQLYGPRAELQLATTADGVRVGISLPYETSPKPRESGEAEG